LGFFVERDDPGPFQKHFRLSSLAENRYSNAMSQAIDYANELNAEQLAAVTAPDGAVLIIAAAGTGKTRTLVHRVAYLIDQGIDPTSILLVTFTNKAAKEMLDRARSLVTDTSRGWPRGGTFHSIGNRILRRHADLLGFEKGYNIIDSDDSKRLARGVYVDLGLKAGKEFPQPQVLLSLFSYAVNTERTVESVLHNRFEHHPADIGDMLAVHRGYEAAKKENAAMDFDDLLVNTLRLFDQYPDVLRGYQERYKHVLVDEFQDTNALQASMVERIAALNQNLLVVGDDFQSIYEWRGANFENIMKFPERYENAAVFKLVTNYRSTPDILEVANQAIAGNPEQFQKELRAVKKNGAKPVLSEMFDGGHQARYIVEQIRLMRSEGYKYKDMAVLYRTHFSSIEIDFEFTRERIPFRMTSGVRFFEQAHVKDCVTVLQMIHQPTNRLAFTRFACLLPKVGERTAAKIWAKLKGQFDPMQMEHRMTLLGALPKGAAASYLPVDKMWEQIEAERLFDTPSVVLHMFIESFYDNYALSMYENYERRIDNLRGLCDNVEQYTSLGDFLDEMALQTNLDNNPAASDSQETDVVTLSTIHQAKGLEWKIVFVIWLVEGLFPAGRSLEEDPLAREERRLFYVAVTRAEDHLIMTSPRTRRMRDGGTQYYSPSRFIGELDKSCYKEDKTGYY